MTLGGQTMDTRELIERAEEIDAELSAGVEFQDEEELRKEREEIQAIEDAAIADYLHGETLIRDDYFTDYARELAEDIGAVGPDNQWPLYCIDWERAASELQVDYTQVEYGGSTYHVRA